MPRKLGSKDKQARKKRFGIGKAIGIAAGVAGAGYVGHKAFKAGKKIKDSIDVITALGRPNGAQSAYQKLKKSGKESQQYLRDLYKGAYRDGSRVSLEEVKKFRSAMLKEYRRETGLESAVDTYRAARQHAKSGDIAGQSAAAKKVIKRQRDKVKEVVKKTGDRRNTILLSAYPGNLLSIANFARKEGSKDKTPRKRGLLKKAAIIGATTAGGALGGAVIGGGVGFYRGAKRYAKAFGKTTEKIIKRSTDFQPKSANDVMRRASVSMRSVDRASRHGKKFMQKGFDKGVKQGRLIGGAAGLGTSAYLTNRKRKEDK